MRRELIMTNISLTGEWTDLYTRSNTEGRNIDTVEKAKQVIDVVYGEQLVIHGYEVTDTEIYVLCENEVTPCTNCQNSL